MNSRLDAARKTSGLVAASHTPFDQHGDLEIRSIPRQAAHLQDQGVSGVFILGSTGEGHSLTSDERKHVAEAWSEQAPLHNLSLIVHVGHTSLREAKNLARHAEQLKADAVAAVLPYYVRPRSGEILTDCLVEVAEGAPDTPIFVYDIPGLTGIDFPTHRTLELASARVPTLAGVKYSRGDLDELSRVMNSFGDSYAVLMGSDEILLGALAFGVRGAVGSSYNFAAPIYRRLMRFHALGQMNEARKEQSRAIRVIDLLSSFDYAPAAKFTMSQLGVECGEGRLPQGRLSAKQKQRLEAQLRELGFFDWLKKPLPKVDWSTGDLAPSNCP